MSVYADITACSLLGKRREIGLTSYNCDRSSLRNLSYYRGFS